jgi:uncharacterized protein
MPGTYVFFVYAPDYTDPDAFNRRLSVRSQHLDRMLGLGKKGILSKYPAIVLSSALDLLTRITGMGGALVSPETLETEQKRLIGSGMMFEAESADAVRKILEEDIYWTSNVVCHLFHYRILGPPRSTDIAPSLSGIRRN